MRTSAVKSREVVAVGRSAGPLNLIRGGMLGEDWARLSLMSARPAISVLSSVNPVRGALEW